MPCIIEKIDREINVGTLFLGVENFDKLVRIADKRAPLCL